MSAKALKHEEPPITGRLAPGRSEHATAGVDGCVDVIRAMILSGDLMPGQKVHQAQLAEQLQISRIPVREALSRLHAEGLLVHKPKTGFTVVRFSRDALGEVYLMRRLLETQLLVTADLDQVDANHLVTINTELRSTTPRDHPDVYQRLNQAFHFTVFDASPLVLVRQEVARLWNMSAYYRSLYLFVTEDPSHLCDAHDAIIAAVRAGDHDALVQASDHHRSDTERVESRLPTRPAALLG